MDKSITNLHLKKENQVKIDEDYAHSAVPKEGKKSLLSITIVWTGFVFVITSMMAGGGLAEGLNFTQIIFATLLGNVFLSFIAIAVAILASKTGLSFALITRYSFGLKGSKLATLFIPISNIGWYTIQAATYGHFIASVFGITGAGELLIMALSAILMGVFALIGMNALTILGYIAIPAIIFLSSATAIKADILAGGISNIFAYIPGGKMTLISGISVVIGTWILSTATCIADTMRFAKTTKQAVISSFIGLVGGNSLLIICGAIAAIGVGDSDLTSVLLSLGLVVPSIILMTTNIFTTNASNLYSTSLNLANSFKMSRKKLIIIILIICAALTMTRPYDVEFLFGFLGILGKVVPPLAGIVLSDYYIVNKMDYPPLEDAANKEWDLAPWLTMLISTTLVFIIPFGLPALNGLVISLVLYPLLNKFAPKKYSKEAELHE